MKKKLVVVGLFLCLTGCKNSDENLVKGTWIADGTQYQYATGYDDNEVITTVFDSPFYLEFDGKGNYTLDSEDYTDSGTYTIDDENVYLTTKDKVSFACKLEKEDELSCDMYASLFVKEEN